MKSFQYSLFLIFIVTSTFGQIKFEKGYYIDNSNRKTECLIKNEDSENNPKEFIFKKNLTDLPLEGKIDSVKEFSIYGFSKFIRVSTKIDRSKENLGDLTKNMQPVWSQEVLFLKILIEGKATLYQYKDGNLIRYFYSTSVSPIQQLVYKPYSVDNYNIGYNITFRQQLWNDVRIQDIDIKTMEKINYKQKDLVSYFTKYSRNSSDQVTDFSCKAKSRRDWFNLKITTGLNLSSVSLTYGYPQYSLRIDNNLSCRFGIQSEFIMPFNLNKWSFIFEPTFQYFNSQGELININDSNKKYIVKVDYKSIEFPLGLRYYTFLNDNTKLFFNGFLILWASPDFNSKFILNNDDKLDISTRNSFAIGGGIEHKRISAEIRYYTNRELLSEYSSVSDTYNRLSLVVGYNLFKSKPTSDCE